MELNLSEQGENTPWNWGELVENGRGRCRLKSDLTGIIQRCSKFARPDLPWHLCGSRGLWRFCVSPVARHLSNGCPTGGPWDVLLFSGGGNDIVDNPMALWIKDWNPAMPPAKHIHQPRFDTALALVRAGYEDLIELRDKLSPSTQLVFQGYDFAIPDGRGVCHLGPWLKPTFDLRNFPTRAAAQEVVKAMLQQFASMLTSLATQPKVTFINGQGTLPPQTSSWHNELHPTRDGFKKFADIFYQKLKNLYPDRVA